MAGAFRYITGPLKCLGVPVAIVIAGLSAYNLCSSYTSTYTVSGVLEERKPYMSITVIGDSVKVSDSPELIIVPEGKWPNDVNIGDSVILEVKDQRNGFPLCTNMQVSE